MFKKIFLLLNIFLFANIAKADEKSQLVKGQLTLGCPSYAVCIAAYQPIKATLVITSFQEGKKTKIVKEIKTDSDGNFSTKLKPGVYSISFNIIAEAETPLAKYLGEQLYIPNGKLKVTKGLSTEVTFEAFVYYLVG